MEYIRMVVTGIAILAAMIVVSIFIKLVSVAVNLPTSPIYFDFTNVRIVALVGFGAVCIGFALYIFLVFIIERIREAGEVE